jgi:hypothetical protein
MSFVQRRVLRRLSFLGRLVDLIIVSGAVARLAVRNGWIGEDHIEDLGLADSGITDPMSIADIALALGATWRLLRRRPGRD